MPDRYRAAFRIDAPREEVVGTLRDWVRHDFDGEWPDSARAGRWDSEHQSLAVHELAHGEHWALQIEHELRLGPADVWEIDAQLAQEGDAPLEFEVAVRHPDPARRAPRGLRLARWSSSGAAKRRGG